MTLSSPFILPLKLYPKFMESKTFVTFCGVLTKIIFKKSEKNKLTFFFILHKFLNLAVFLKEVC